MRGFDRIGASIGRHAVLLVAVAAMVLPVVWALITSFKPARDAYNTNPLPIPFSLENYDAALNGFPLGTLLFNTTVMALGVTCAQLAVATLAGYAMVRFPGRASRLTATAAALALAVPLQSMIIPQFLMVSELGWLNSYAGLIVPQLAGCALPVLLLRNHVGALPSSPLDAATMDGANSWELLWHIVLPQLRPALAAVGILVFIGTWNEYLWPMLIAPSPERSTIQLGLQLFSNQEGANAGPMLAAAAMATLPVVLVYLFASRRITDAFTQSGLR